MILGHSVVWDLILWRGTSNIVIVIVVQIASTCEVGRTLVFMRATILCNVSAVGSSGKAKWTTRTISLHGLLRGFAQLPTHAGCSGFAMISGRHS